MTPKLGYALALGGGVALYLLGHAVFRLVLRLGSVRHALLCAGAGARDLPLGLMSAIAHARSGHHGVPGRLVDRRRRCLRPAGVAGRRRAKR